MLDDVMRFAMEGLGELIFSFVAVSPFADDLHRLKIFFIWRGEEYVRAEWRPWGGPQSAGALVCGGVSGRPQRVWTSRAVRDRAAQLGIEMPITSAICRVLFEGQNAKDAVRDLMIREMKSE